MTLEDLKNNLLDYLAGERSLARFQEWFIPAGWNIDPSNETSRFVNEIELRLAEYTNGHLIEDELKKALGTVLNRTIQSQPSQAAFVPTERGFTVVVHLVSGSAMTSPNQPIMSWPTSEWVGRRS